LRSQELLNFCIGVKQPDIWVKKEQKDRYRNRKRMYCGKLGFISAGAANQTWLI
jgi:hypothetical protein